MNSEENDDLWRLLGRAKQPAISPFFARNVIRRIRTADQSPGFFKRLCQKWVPATVGATAAILLAVNAPHFFATPDPDAVLLAQQISSKSDVDVIDHLDELIAQDDNSVWLENSPQ